MSDAVDQCLLVVAIDLGSSYSGYAYQIRSDHENNPTRVFAPHWTHGDNSMITSKTNSSILFKDDQSFFSFGYQAEQDFCNLCMGTLDGYENANHLDWYFFHAFKMQLYRESAEAIYHSMTLKDISGKKIKALDVFAASIHYLKTTAFNDVSNRRKKDTFKEQDIKWVVTVPAIWNDSAKQFVRLACEKAGIAGQNVILALEPEAAAIFCKGFMAEENREDKLQLVPFDRGCSFMVLDLGGGTADITVYTIDDDHRLQELHKASGGDWGGENVDSKFMDLWINVLGEKQYKDIKKNTPNEILDLRTRFQSIKRQMDSEQSSYWMTVPHSFQNVSDFAENISKIDDGKITFARGKVKLPLSCLKEMFYEPVFNLIKHLEQLFMEPNLQGVKTVLMVGGFSESSFVQKRVREAFSSKEFVIPEECNLAVLSGAAMFGFDQRSISSRISRYTYGISSSRPFDVDRDPPHHKYEINGQDRCEDVFDVFVRAGDTVYPGKTKVTKRCRTLSQNTSIALYGTRNKDPKFVMGTPEETRDCRNVGCIDIDLSHLKPPEKHNRLFDVTMFFSEVDMTVTAKDVKSKTETKARLNLLK